MKVVHFIATLDVGGAEKQLLTLCQEQVSHGYKVTVLPLKGSNSLASEFEASGVEVDNQIRNKGTLVQYIKTLLIVLRFSRCVLHAHSAKIQILLSLLPVSLHGQLVISKHDSMQFISQVPSYLSRFLWGWVQFRASRVLVISQAIAEEMDLRGELVDKNKLVKCYYGISNKEISEIGNANRKVIRASWGVSEKDFVIGSVGRLVREKNHLFLLEVFQQFLKVNPGAVLIVCGYGPLEVDLEKAIENLKIESKVKILNNIRKPKEVYAGFDLFVLPSLTEGFGLVLLEAMSADLPIIASNVGAIPEVLGNNYRFMFNPLNHQELLDTLVSSEKESVRKTVARQTSLRLENFKSEAMFSRMDSIYRSL